VPKLERSTAPRILFTIHAVKPVDPLPLIVSVAWNRVGAEDAYSLAGRPFEAITSANLVTEIPVPSQATPRVIPAGDRCSAVYLSWATGENGNTVGARTNLTSNGNGPDSCKLPILPPRVKHGQKIERPGYSQSR